MRRRGLGERLARLRAGEKSKPPPATAAERFATLRTIGAANDAFLDRLARLQGAAQSPSLTLARLTDTYEALAAPVGIMARALARLGNGRYDRLLARFEKIDRDVSHDVLRAHAIEFGPLVLWPSDADATRPELVGPKAARLAALATSWDYDVPPFFAVTVHGYRFFMEATGLEELIAHRLATTDLRDRSSLLAFSQWVRSQVLATEVPDGLAATLLGGVRRLMADGARGVAVRSSAVVEDAESSFAGQFDSVLNVREADALTAFKRVVASKYRVEALKYAHARGYVDEDVAMPVLVMAMVHATASGVAYSRAPDDPGRALVSAVAGLAQPIVDGRVIPDLYLVSPGAPGRIVERIAGLHSVTLECDPSGGVVERRAAEEDLAAVDETCALRAAHVSWSLERQFGAPQDVEWALDGAGVLHVVQTRPLGIPGDRGGRAGPEALVPGYRILLRGGDRACGGIAHGPVFRVGDEVADVPDGCILVVRATSPRLAAVVGSVAGIVAASGSATGHMATIAREFGVPCLVGARAAMATLADGEVVTLDADAAVVYQGRVPELDERSPASPRPARSAVDENLEKLLAHVARLTLTDPDSPDFTPESCRTLHDIARFVHQKAMVEVFSLHELTPRERRACRPLVWSRPIAVLVLDLGGGTTDDGEPTLSLDQITSAPLQALLEGMGDSRLRWAGPVGFDLKGFMSVIVRSAADDQRYGEPSYAICASDYVHFASRLAYHFALVDGICGDSVNENYVRFRFYGGAAVAERREWRAFFLSTVLRANGLVVTQVGDRVDASLAKRPAAELEDLFVMLGRLMVASRQLDMVLDSGAAATALAHAFLAGDYGFDRVRSSAEPS